MGLLITVFLSFVPVLIFVVFRIYKQKDYLKAIANVFGIFLLILVCSITVFRHIFYLDEIIILLSITAAVYILILFELKRRSIYSFDLIGKVATEFYNMTIIYMLSGGLFLVLYKLFYPLENPLNSNPIYGFIRSVGLSVPLIVTIIAMVCLLLIRKAIYKFIRIRYISYLPYLLCALFIVQGQAFEIFLVEEEDYYGDIHSLNAVELGVPLIESYEYNSDTFTLVDERHLQRASIQSIYRHQNQLFVVVEYHYYDYSSGGSGSSMVILTIDIETMEIVDSYYEDNPWEDIEYVLGYSDTLYYFTRNYIKNTDGLEIHHSQGRNALLSYEDGVTTITYSSLELLDDAWTYRIHTVVIDGDDYVESSVLLTHEERLEIAYYDILDHEGNLFRTIAQSDLLYQDQEHIIYNSSRYVSVFNGNEETNLTDRQYYGVVKKYDNQFYVSKGYYIERYDENLEFNGLLFDRDLSQNTYYQNIIDGGIIEYKGVLYVLKDKVSEDEKSIEISLDIVHEPTLNLSYHYYIPTISYCLLLVVFAPFKKESS